MLNGLSGSLLSHYFAESLLHVEFAGRIGEQSAARAHLSLKSWWQERGLQLGPASSLRSIWNAAAVPLAEQLGFAVSVIESEGDTRLGLLTHGDTRVGLVAGQWSGSLDRLWRDAVRCGIELETWWALCTNGHQIRLVDTQRTYSRVYAQFDIALTIDDPRTFRAFWGLLRAETFRSLQHKGPLIAQIVRASERHGQAVSRSLKSGVIESVEHLLIGLSKCEKRDLPALFDESLTVVYRTLFLMFAEARGLVPNWHPVYRKSYTIESLRERIERPDRARGLWETLQAISRLAHRGCRAGTLVVPAFNGRLFSPSRAPIAESCAVDDELARKALLGLSTTRVRSRRTRIDYRDLGVEQLGAVYEGVLDYEPAFTAANTGEIVLRRGSDRRKSTGSFYTPQSLTDYVVRRTLHPLVAEAPAEKILGLRVVDPAMGSAAFLVSACRYLATAYERALIRQTPCNESDIDDTDRAAFRRQIAQRCLFGVDLNPTAVQLARLSLWLATLAANRPLTFLDHRLLCGDSLLGASPVDIVRRPPGSGRRDRGDAPTPLFAEGDLEMSLAHAVGERRWLAETVDDTVDIVREKERRLERLRKMNDWKTIADLWCACWMWPRTADAPSQSVFPSLCDEATTGRSSLPGTLAEPLLKTAGEISRERRFFHWVLEFPEAYFDEHGQPLPEPGFDAVLGNPPWDMLAAESGEKPFFRSSGVYRHQGGGRINRYQVFVERALSLARRGGRIGLVVPSGLATDHTAAQLRRELLTHSRVDTISGFDNRKAIFPIHRSVRFMIWTMTKGAPTARIGCRFGIGDPTVLESIPDSSERTNDLSHPVSLTPDLIKALSDETLTIPEVRNELDVRILEGIVHRVPRLRDAEGWNVHFGRELNATDDRPHFQTGRGIPVLEGKHIEPFRAHPNRAYQRIKETTAARLLDATATFMRSRLAYRDVASSTNRITLIAAIIPAGVVTTHSLFCLKTRLSTDNQAFLCGMLNSFVANYLIRLVMTTHLGSSTVEALRVPKPGYDTPAFIQVVESTRMLEKSESPLEYAKLQAVAAWCYGLTQADFIHVLSTFPLVPAAERREALEEFRKLKEISEFA
jgi:N-6 DNA Methylase/Eco57I restriction-modification methylase